MLKLAPLHSCVFIACLTTATLGIFPGAFAVEARLAVKAVEVGDGPSAVAVIDQLNVLGSAGG